MPHRSYHQVSQRHSRSSQLLIGIVVLIALTTGLVYGWHAAAAKESTESTHKAARATASYNPAVTTVPKPTACAQNKLDKDIVVSISKRHLWACSSDTVSYDSAVVTGMENLPADLTPTGIYHIYAKYTDTNLIGHDSTGSWNDHVSYWLPWLHNQYGSYGFHDATWRKDSDFGNISPYSSDASHGCVELPLATAKWLYDWAPIGTTVTIVS